MLSFVLKQIIEQTFEKEVGRWQSKNKEQKAFLVDFSVSLDTNIASEGYLHKQLLIFAEANYVGVYTRKTWNYCPNGKKEWEKGYSNWEVLCYHDSCWRSSINDFLFENRESISTVGIGPQWYAIELVDEHTAKFLKEARKRKYD